MPRRRQNCDDGVAMGDGCEGAERGAVEVGGEGLSVRDIAV